MKKWTGFIISFVVIVLFAYYVMGFIVERTLNKNLNAIPQSPVVSLHLDTYQRGWFSSKAILSLQMHIPAQESTDKNGAPKINPAVDFDMNFPLTIIHGPVIFTDSGIRFGLGQITTTPQTHYGAFINYFNRTILKYTLPSFSMDGQVGGDDGSFKISWMGLRALLSVSSNLNTIDGDLDMYGFTGSANNIDFKIGEVTNNFNLSRNEDGLWLGTSHFAVPLITVTAGTGQLFDLGGFDIKIGSDVTDGALNFNLNLSLKKLVVANKTYSDGVMKLTIKNLDPVVMAKINRMQMNMIQSNGDASLPALAVLAELPKLFAKGSELEVSEMTLNLPEGTVTGNLKIVLPKEELNAPEQLMQKAKGDGQLRAPMAVVKALMMASIKSNSANQIQTGSDIPVSSSGSSTPASTTVITDTDAQKQVDTLLQNYVDKGLLKIEGTDYVITFQLENQQVMVNGKPFDPSMLQ